MKYRRWLIAIGITIMAVDTIVSLRYPKILIYSYWGAFLGFVIPFGIGLSTFLYGIFKAHDYGVNSVIGTLGSGGFTSALRQTKSQGTRIWISDHDVLSDMPGAVKSPDSKTVKYSNIIIKKPYGATKYSRLLNEAANKYLSDELDEEGFYNYIGKH
ncbi:hypothetical protein ACLIKE_02575, partial [Ferroplasma acidiphilum]